MKNGNASDKNSNERIVNFEEVRAKRLEEKRRKTERIFFQQILGVYSVIGNETMAPISIVDVSDTGLSFQTPFNAKKQFDLKQGEMPLRIYFSQDTYLEILVKIQNVRPTIEEGEKYNRYGCSIASDTGAYEAYAQFVKFLKLYTEHCHKDTGKVQLFYL